MLKKFLLTAVIAAAVFGLSIGVIAISSLWGTDNTAGYYTAAIFYYIAFYLTPIAFLVGVIGSIVCAIKSRIGKRNIS